MVVVAPILVDAGLSVVYPDLRGYGRSTGPEPDPGHESYSDQAMSNDVAALMRTLGYQCWAVVGHDRGQGVAFRLAMDAPSQVSALVVLDGVPIVEALERADARFAELWWHWFFFASLQAERVITADPLAWYQLDPVAMGQENYDDLVNAISNLSTVRPCWRTTVTLCTWTVARRSKIAMPESRSPAQLWSAEPSTMTWSVVRRSSDHLAALVLAAAPVRQAQIRATMWRRRSSSPRQSWSFWHPRTPTEECMRARLIDPPHATVQAMNRQLTNSAHRIIDTVLLRINHPAKRIFFLARSPSTIKIGNATSTYRGIPISGISGLPKSAGGTTRSKL
jgi:pimeloyl-ACP methyl ester carboxylesterase